jgi:hypothetical protein
MSSFDLNGTGVSPIAKRINLNSDADASGLVSGGTDGRANGGGENDQIDAELSDLSFEAMERYAFTIVMMMVMMVMVMMMMVMMMMVMVMMVMMMMGVVMMMTMAMIIIMTLAVA